MVLRLPVDYPDRAGPQGLEHTVLFKVLAERHSLAFTLCISVKPLYQRLAAHLVGPGLTVEFEDRGYKRRLIGCKRYLAAVLPARRPDD